MSIEEAKVIAQKVLLCSRIEDCNFIHVPCDSCILRVEQGVREEAYKVLDDECIILGNLMNDLEIYGGIERKE